MILCNNFILKFLATGYLLKNLKIVILQRVPKLDFFFFLFFYEVSTCLKVFCDEMLSALKTHPAIDHTSVTGTANVIRIFIKFWKIINVRGIGADVRYKDPDRAVIRSVDNSRYIFYFCKIL